MEYNSLLREERPDFKAYNNGFASLNNVELLSIIIGQGNDQGAALQQARQLLNMCGGKLHDIANRRAEEYEIVQGVGPKKALVIQAAFELAKRIEHEAASECEVFDNAQAVWCYFRPMLGTADHEEAHVLLMNNRFRLIKSFQLSTGGLTETAVDVRVVLREALLNNATTLTLVHNHPSGNNRPSRDDDSLTLRLKKACETMRIFLVDHVIVTDRQYYSYNEEGRM